MCAPFPASTALAPNNTARHVINLINGFMWIKQLRIIASAATILGKPADAAGWTLLANKAAASYNQLCYSTAAGLHQDIECKQGEESTPLHPCHRTGERNNGDGEPPLQTVQALALSLGLPVTQADHCVWATHWHTM